MAEIRTVSTNYLITIVVMLAMSGMLVLAIIYLRPQMDPLLVVGGVGAIMGPTMTGILSFLKSQETLVQSKETNLAVNGRLEAFSGATSVAARAEGIIAGTASEQQRIESARVVHEQERLITLTEARRIIAEEKSQRG